MIPPTEVKIDSRSLHQYAGEYEWEAGERLRITAEDNRLFVTPSILFPTRLVPESEFKFFLEGAPSDTYFFNQDDEGRIKSVTRHLSLFGYSRDAYRTARRLPPPAPN
jgi:hypothetical protein